MDIIPTTMVDAFAKGAMLQIILLSVLFGLAFIQAGERGKAAVAVIDSVLDGLFRIVAMVMRLAPIGAGAGVAFTISKYGLSTVWSLAYLMLAVYVTSAMFIAVVIGSVCRWTGFSLVKVLGYFKDEILITFGTCSTEAVMPRMMAKLERLGCEKSVVGLVLPTGYTFNADGTCIYLTMAAIFVAQATNTPPRHRRPTRGPRGAAPDLEGVGGCGWCGLRDTRGDAIEHPHRPCRRSRPSAWRRSLHE